MIVFPPRNLPGTSADWGRHVETRLRGLRKTQESTSSSFRNLERSTGGQLDQTSRIVDELLSRSTEVIYPEDMSVAGNATSEPFPRSFQTVQFPGVPGNRSGFLVVSGFVSSSPFVPVSSVLFVRVEGQRLLRLTPLPGGGAASDPVESQNLGYFSGFGRVGLLDNAPVQIQLEFVRANNSTFSTLTLSNISLSLTRSGT